MLPSNVWPKAWSACTLAKRLPSHEARYDAILSGIVSATFVVAAVRASVKVVWYMVADAVGTTPDAGR